MKFFVDTQIIMRCLNRNLKFIPMKAIYPALECFHFKIFDNSLEVVSFDGEKACFTKCSVRSDGNFAFAIPARLLSQTLFLTNEPEISFEVIKNNCVIKAGKNKYRLSIHVDYPDVKKGVKEHEITVDGSKLKEVILSSLRFIAEEVKRPVFLGVNIKIRDNNIFFESSDSFVISQIKVECRSIVSWKEILVPATLLKILVDLIEDKDIVSIYHDGKNITFNTFSTECTSVVMNEKYPDCDAIFDKIVKASFIKLNKNELETASKRVCLYAKGELLSLCDVISNGSELHLHGVDTYGNNECDEYIGIIENYQCDKEVTIKAEQLLSITQSLDDNDVLMYITNEVTPIFIRRITNADRRFIIAPMKR